MASFKSVLPFWRHPVPGGGAVSAPLPAKPDDFGTASGFELLFSRLMDDPVIERDVLFSSRNRRY